MNVLGSLDIDLISLCFVNGNDHQKVATRYTKFGSTHSM
jgi:hypothetical protein